MTDADGKAMSTADIEELLGAYALDAVDADERALVERHLAGCPRCRDELQGHLEVAAMLANTGAPAPDRLWERIAGALDEPPPPMRLTVTPPATGAGMVALVPRRRGLTRILTAAVSVAALVIVVLGVQVARQNHRLDQMAADIHAGDLDHAASVAMGDPVSHKMMLTSPTGDAMSAAAVMTPTGTGYLMAASLPQLPADRTYQLWAMVDGRVISVGVLGNAPRTSAFQVGTAIQGLLVTEEAAGGVASSGSPPLLMAKAV